MWVDRLLPVIIVSAFLSGTAGSQDAPASDARIQQEILQVEAERDKAMQKGDMPTLNRIYADNVVIINTRGHLLTKAQRLADFQSGDLKFLSFNQGDYTFHIYRNTVILNGRANSAVQFHGKINRIPRRFTLTYHKENGEWRLIAQNETLIDE
jgi:ketosteroid isomerase-like protein